MQTPQQRLNIVVIGIDTWRYDAMTPAISPNIYQFAKKALQFRNQWSGGNCTEPGLFSFIFTGCLQLLARDDEATSRACFYSSTAE